MCNTEMFVAQNVNLPLYPREFLNYGDGFELTLMLSQTALYV
jgi:hypothetical protein